MRAAAERMEEEALHFQRRLTDAGMSGIRDRTRLLDRLGAIENARHLDIYIEGEDRAPRRRRTG